MEEWRSAAGAAAATGGAAACWSPARLPAWKLSASMSPPLASRRWAATSSHSARRRQ